MCPEPNDQQPKEKDKTPNPSAPDTNQLLKEYENIRHNLYKAPLPNTKPSDETHAKALQTAMKAMKEDIFNNANLEVAFNTKKTSCSPVPVTKTFKPAAGNAYLYINKGNVDAAKIEGANKALIDDLVTNMPVFQNKQKDYLAKNIAAEIKNRKTLLLGFYFGDGKFDANLQLDNLSNDQKQATNFVHLRDGYFNGNEEDAKKYIQEQLKQLDETQKQLEAKLETYQKTEKDNLEKNLKEKANLEQAKSFGVAAAAARGNKPTDGKDLNVSSDGSIDDTHVDKRVQRWMYKYGIEVTLTPTEDEKGNKKTTIQMHLPNSKPETVKEALARIRHALLELLKNPKITEISIDNVNRDNMELAKQVWQEVQLLKGANFPVRGYQPTAADLKEFDEINKRRDTIVNTHEKNTAEQLAPYRWLENISEKSHLDSTRTSEWFQLEGKKLFDKWCKAQGQPSSETALTDWWNKGGAKSAYQQWAKENPASNSPGLGSSN